MPPGSSTLDEHKGNLRFYAVNGVVSLAVLAFLAWLLLLRSAAPGDADVSFLPAVNAGFNALAAAFLVTGWFFVKRGRLSAHRTAMIAAFVCLALFFRPTCLHTLTATQYLVRRARARVLRRPRTHVLLSMAVVPLALTAFWFAYKRRFDRHTRVTRVLLPIWLYVSVTGVVIFFMLRGVAS